MPRIIVMSLVCLLQLELVFVYAGRTILHGKLLEILDALAAGNMY